MFDFSTHDLILVGASTGIVAGAFVVIAVVHNLAPKVGAWFTKEKASVAALEAKMGQGLGALRGAVTGVDAKINTFDTKVRTEFSGALNAATGALAARVAALEAFTGIAPTTPAAK